MFKNLQSTIFCFAAVILAIVLIASSCSDNKKKAELNSMIEALSQRNDELQKEAEKTKQELEATKAEAKLLSDQIKAETERVKAETERGQKYLKRAESLAAANLAQKEQLENAKKQLADIQAKLLVTRQLAANSANPQELKKLEDELKTAKDALKAVKDDLANKDLQLKVLMPQSRKLAEQLLEARKQLDAVKAKGQTQSKGQTQPKKK